MVRKLGPEVGVSPLRFLNDPSEPVRRIRELQSRTDTICRRYPDCDRDVVFRTLMNLDLPPIDIVIGTNDATVFLMLFHVVF